MTNRLLHTDAKGTTLELTDTGGIHRLVTTHEQGAATVVLSVDIPAPMANALIGTPGVVLLSDNDLGTALAQVLILDGRTHSADAYQIADKLVPAIQNLLRANTPAAPKPATPSPALLRDALTVALRGHKPLDTDELADRAAGVVEKILAGRSGNQVPPWTPEFAVQTLMNEDAPPHLSAAARGVLGLPLEAEAKTEGAATNPDWQPTPGAGARRVGLARFRTRPVPGPVMYGSPWDSAFGDEVTAPAFSDEVLAAAAARAAAEDELIDVNVLDEDEEDLTPLLRAKPGKPEKKAKKAKKNKPEKPGKGKALGLRIAVLRYVVDHLDGDMPFPAGPKGPAWEFYTRSLERIESFILENGMNKFIYDPRGNVPSFGYGTPLDHLTVTELLELAAALPLTSFEENEGVRDYQSFEDALKAVLHDVYEDLWSVVGDGLAQGDLTVDEHHQVALTDRPEDEPDENAEHALDG